MRTIPSQGRVIANGNDAAIARVLARGAWAPVERFGPGQPWRTGDMESETTFSILHEGRPEGVVQEWPLMGEHNRLNALAAIAAARHAGVPVHQAAQSLAMFKGVKRRMELRGRAGGVAVYDDFAHHPTAFETTIAGLKRRVNGGRVIAVFEPRSNTMKLGTMQERLAASLAGADLVFCYAASLGWDPTLALSTLGARAAVHQELDALVEAVARAARAGDHVLVMSNGGFGGIHAKLLDRLGAATRGEAA
jgi:UDP-N-acetylmuramate: L-alanyl-gamma-D-glutamyl-meso-diaminopimelate ligase